MRFYKLLLFVQASFILTGITTLYGQQADSSCKVLMTSISGTYSGDCKKGLANGLGESKGVHQYTGSFKNGFPNGKGTYYYGKNKYYTGNFLDGMKEGKGEMHFIKDDLSDSTVKGYWSADEYRGKTYSTYKLDVGFKMDRFDITPSSQSGNQVTFNIFTTGNAVNSDKIRLYSVASLEDGSLVKLILHAETQDYDLLVIEVSKFPLKMKGMLTNGLEFNLDLYKSADWNVKFYCHR